MFLVICRVNSYRCLPPPLFDIISSILNIFCNIYVGPPHGGAKYTTSAFKVGAKV